MGIKDGKIFDITTLLYNKRDDSLSDKAYILTKERDLMIEDTWDFENNTSLKDSPLRDIEPESSKIDLLKEKVKELEYQILELENKIA